MGYEHTQVTDELNRNVQRAVGVPTRRHETLGELVKSIAPKRWVRRPENLISGESTRYEVRVDGKVMHTFCFVDALMLPFVLGGVAVEVCLQATTVVLSMQEALDLGRDWTSGSSWESEEEERCC